jgi:hypothetical protein
VTIPVKRLHLIPGSFRGSRYPVETICWDYLSKEEEEEGHWSRVGEVVIPSSLTYDHDSEQKYCSWYSKLIDCTQDDNGTLLRMTRSSRDGNRASKRASSQPPSERRTRREEEVISFSRIHAWLPLYHYCYGRSTWTVSCHYRRLWSWKDSAEPRSCAYQTDNKNIAIDSRLKKPSFLGEIRNCKSFPRRFGDTLHPLLRHSHRVGYPQGVIKLTSRSLRNHEICSIGTLAETGREVVRMSCEAN